MESSAKLADRARRRRRRSDPLVLVPVLTGFATVGAWFVLGVLQLVYGFGEEWVVAGYTFFPAIAIPLLLLERRRFLAQPPVEPGADEASWRAAEEDLRARDALLDRRAVALVIFGLALLPLCILWWWERREVPMASMFYITFLVIAAAIVLPWRRAKREGMIRLVEGSSPPDGWATLGLVAVGLPLAWSPLAVMAAAAEPEALLLFAIPVLHALAWWWSSHGWRSPLRVDLRLPDIPIDWRRRQRDDWIAAIPWLMFFADYGLVMTAGVAIDEAFGGGCAVFFLLPIGFVVLVGLLGTGWAFFTRPMRRAGAQPAASLSR